MFDSSLKCVVLANTCPVRDVFFTISSFRLPSLLVSQPPPGSFMPTAESNHGSRPSSVYSSSLCATVSFGIGHPVHPSPCPLYSPTSIISSIPTCTPTRILSAGTVSLPTPRNHPALSNSFSAFSTRGQTCNLLLSVRCHPYVSQPVGLHIPTHHSRVVRQRRPLGIFYHPTLVHPPS